MASKKYFSISEVCAMCLLPLHKLRYIDKVDKNISVIKIRDRRYYTIENVNYIINTYSNLNSPIKQKSILHALNISVKNKLSIRDSEKNSNSKIIQQIDNLIEKFQTLTEDLNILNQQ